MIEQRLREGYYEADAATLRTMQDLVAAIRRLRENAELEGADASLSPGEL